MKGFKSETSQEVRNLEYMLKTGCSRLEHSSLVVLDVSNLLEDRFPSNLHPDQEGTVTPKTIPRCDPIVQTPSQRQCRCIVSQITGAVLFGGRPRTVFSSGGCRVWLRLRWLESINDQKCSSGSTIIVRSFEAWWCSKTIA